MTPRITLFAIFLILFGAVMEDAEAQTCPRLPSPVIPSQRAWTKAASNLKGAEPQSQQYNSGDPSQDEQYYLELLNRARMNPPAAGVEISNTTDPDVSSEFTYWITQDPDEPTRARIKSDFANYKPKQPLAMNAALLTAARAHSQDMLTNNYQGHQGSDGSWPWDRAQKAGYPSLFGGSPYVGENAAAYATSLYDAYAGWLIDFGVPNDTQWGHRNNCLEFRTGSDTINPGYTECGPGMIPNPGGGYPASTGPLVSTLDFGDAGKHFVLGVVYADQNKNGRYDPGEGISGVRIDVTGASYYAISATYGGYAIPVTGSGTLTVKATGGIFGTAGITQQVNFDGSQNVKVDFTPDLSGYPSQAMLLVPAADQTVHADSAVFTWDAAALATKYHIQIGTDSLLKQKLLVNDSVLTDTMFKYGVFKDSTTYYWRVQAKNTKGMGPWSGIAAFSIGLPPNSVALISPASGATVGDSGVMFLWHMANKGVQSYAIVVASDKSLKNVIWTDTLLSDPNDTSDLASSSNFMAGQTYYWSVSGYNDYGWGHPSALRSFTVSSASVAISTIGNNELITVSPNPTTGVVHLRFTLQTTQDVWLRLFNNLGDEVKSISLGACSAGVNRYDFDGSMLAAGTYSFELRVGNRTETGRIVLVK